MIIDLTNRQAVYRLSVFYIRSEILLLNFCIKFCVKFLCNIILYILEFIFDRKHPLFYNNFINNITKLI